MCSGVQCTPEVDHPDSDTCFSCCPHREENIRGVEEIGRDPHLAIENLSSKSIDIKRLAYAVNCLRFRWSGDLRAAGITPVFIRLCLEGYECSAGSLRRDEFIWEWPIQGISNVITAIIDDPCDADDVIRKEIKAAYSSIIGVIRGDMHGLRRPGKRSDELRLHIVELLLKCCRILDLKQDMGDRATLDLAMCCWINMCTVHPSSSDLLNRLYFVHRGVGVDESLINALCPVTVDVLKEKLSGRLLDPELLDEDLKLELIAWGSFLLSEGPLIKDFVAARAYDYILKALSRQRDRGTDVEQTKSMFRLVDGVLTGMLPQVDNFILKLSEMVRDCGLLELIAEALCVTTEAEKSGFHHLFGIMTRAARVSGPLRESYRTYKDLCKTLMFRLYITTLTRLRAAPNPDRAINQWMAFADGLGLSEQAIRKQLMEENECCYAECPHYCRAERRIMQCGRCSGIQYCSLECQRGDWKNHKSHCKPKVHIT